MLHLSAVSRLFLLAFSSLPHPSENNNNFRGSTLTLSWCNRKRASCCCLFISYFNARFCLPLCKISHPKWLIGLKKYKPEHLLHDSRLKHARPFSSAATETDLFMQLVISLWKVMRNTCWDITTAACWTSGCYLVSARQLKRSVCLPGKLQVTTPCISIRRAALPSRPTTVCVAAMCRHISV